MFQGTGGVNICNVCVERGYMMLQENELVDRKRGGAAAAKAGEIHQETLLKPQEIKAVLDEYVIGQDDAKRYMSVAVYNHYKRLLSRENGDKSDVEIDKSNIVLVGATINLHRRPPRRYWTHFTIATAMIAGFWSAAPWILYSVDEICFELARNLSLLSLLMWLVSLGSFLRLRYIRRRSQREIALMRLRNKRRRMAEY